MGFNSAFKGLTKCAGAFVVVICYINLQAVFHSEEGAVIDFMESCTCDLDL